ncbi:MAG: L-seryl-tRNA(Sec) selenium transferase [Actinomycetota bacterium]
MAQVTRKERPGLRRGIPSVDALLRSAPGVRIAEAVGRPLLKQALTSVLLDVRTEAAAGVSPPEDDVLLARAAQLASSVVTGLTPAINATGVILHTGLGRAPLPANAAKAAAKVARSYSDLEVDRARGLRGKRTTRAEALLTAITGAESAFVVNNNAAALLLMLAAIARRKEVLVSRGELIEIGGEFRLPDIMSASGAKLVEVGTTNRTRIGDYRSAITEKTGAILKVHPSNYRIVGFAASPTTKVLADLARARGLPLLYDLGSGLLRRTSGLPDDEPSVYDALADGTDLACFSGDKLLGGPQAGIVVGRGELVERLRTHPLARALRVDKMQVAALEAVLRAHEMGREADLPVHRMLHESSATVRDRAQRLEEALDGELEGAHIAQSEAVVGGGSMPGHALGSWSVFLSIGDPQEFAARLRTGAVPVFCRVEETTVSFDLRTVDDDELPHLARAILYALEGDPNHEAEHDDDDAKEEPSPS